MLYDINLNTSIMAYKHLALEPVEWDKDKSQHDSILSLLKILADYIPAGEGG